MKHMFINLGHFNYFHLDKGKERSYFENDATIIFFQNTSYKKKSQDWMFLLSFLDISLRTDTT